MNEFEQLSAAKAHAEEIKTSRVGGLGGSDCKVYGGVRISFYTF